MANTPTINLRKPARADFVSVVNDINDNMDKIDSYANTTNQAIANLNKKFTWTKIAEVTQSANASVDSTVDVTYPENCTEIMFTIQRTSNGRTIASTVCPIVQFGGGAVYAFGSYALASGAINAMTVVGVNAVCIDAGNNQVEIAANACVEALKYRLFVR